MDWISRATSSPFGACLAWDKGLIWLNVISDALMALAYFSIPLALCWCLRRRSNLHMRRPLYLCAGCLLACGLVHSAMIWNIWHTHYWWAGVLKAGTALVSLGLATMLWPLIPRLLAMPSPRALKDANEKLTEINAELKKMLAEEQALNKSKELYEQVQEYVEELKRAKAEVERANSAQTRFLTNISHEIRTPLGGILGYADKLLCDSAVAGEQRETLVFIKRCANHLRNLINDILDISKIEAGKLEVESVKFDFVQLLHQVASVMDVRMREKNIKFKIVFQNKIPTRIYSDPLRLRQILINLLGNAAKFTDDGLVTLEVASRGFAESENGRLIFGVLDTGCGITSDKQATLFKRFSQVDDSLTRKAGGTGLGLVLSRRLARKLGGDLELIESAPSEGTCFRFYIQTCIEPHSRFVDEFIPGTTSAEEAFDSNEIAGALEDVSILLVEDGIDNQRIFSYFLRMAGARVHIAQDGRSGLDKAKGGYDVILMDIQLPLIDGYTATSELRRRGYKKPIIALTAHAMREEQRRCMENGFTDYLSKPVHIPRLIKVVAKHSLERREKEQAMAHSPALIPKSKPPVERSKTQLLPPPARVHVMTCEEPLRSAYHDQPIYRSMIRQFADSVPRRLAEIERNLNCGDWQSLGDEAHKMKGAASTYGYPLLSDLAAQVESAAKGLASGETHRHEEARLHLTTFAGLAERIARGAADLELEPDDEQVEQPESC